VTTRALHVSDLHAGRGDTPALEEALRALVEEVDPELVLATGDLSHRGRLPQLERARALLTGLGRPLLAVPGNHDIPYTLPARVTRPWRAFELVFGSTDPVYSSERLVVCGLNSVRPWRHQGGALSPERLARAAAAFAAAPPEALRVVALHHHLVTAPWRTSRKLPLGSRDRILATLAEARAELVVGGHIHQGAVAVRPEFDARPETARSPVVLATAPGLGRPRPRRSGEAQGAIVYGWDAGAVAAETYVFDGRRFQSVARREFPRHASS
jgi:3',5'-cyclic AMP phosphodiesterase CpdA